MYWEKKKKKILKENALGEKKIFFEKKIPTKIGLVHYLCNFSTNNYSNFFKKIARDVIYNSMAFKNLYLHVATHSKTRKHRIFGRFLDR